MNPSTLPPRPHRLDIIGDVHGEYRLLVRLLETLGYTCRDATPSRPGLWAHPTRTAVFAGDLIDRGPDAPEVLRVVRRMVEAGHALAVAGNHEFNALGHATADAHGIWLRPRTREKIGPHQSTLDQFATLPEEWADHLKWFRSLPAFLDYDGLRVVHAAWHEPSVALLKTITPWTDETLRLAHRDAAVRAARELVLNGPEVRLPAGAHFFDHAGKRRFDIRTAWWTAKRPPAWQDAVFPPSVPLFGLGETAKASPPPPFYDLSQPPVIFGHYGLHADARSVQVPNAACVDFGAGKGGALGAYRWDGERTLDESKVVRIRNHPVR